jgi:hypothetical protein
MEQYISLNFNGNGTADQRLRDDVCLLRLRPADLHTQLFGDISTLLITRYDCGGRMSDTYLKITTETQKVWTK